MKPPIKSVIEKNEDRYARVRFMKHLVVSQLNGSYDSIRCRAMWASHLPRLVEDEDLDLMAEAIAEALEDVRGKLTRPLVS